MRGRLSDRWRLAPLLAVATVVGSVVVGMQGVQARHSADLVTPPETTVDSSPPTTDTSSPPTTDAPPTTEQGRPLQTATFITTSPRPSVVGESVTITATVVVALDRTPVTEGTVSIGQEFPDDRDFGIVAVDSNGRATITVTFQEAGTPQLVAIYGGTDEFALSFGMGSHIVEPRPATSTTMTPHVNGGVAALPATR